ncbi:MAG: DUF1440 domain-containing protein [Desulfuromonadales bacterium]|nr:DUF1440 domain-containing protein [Desulfuromonadales bacterium]
MYRISPLSKRPAAPSLLLTGAAAGLVAGGVAGQVDRWLDRFVSAEQKRRDRRVRKAPAHVLAGPYFARKLLGKKLSKTGERRARMVFNVAYGLVWGTIYGQLRTRVPRLSRWAGLPFAVPFFFACDGTMAPLLGVSPRLRKIPWQPNVKELGNHIAWTAAAEMVHRAVTRAAAHRRQPRRLFAF